MNFIKLIFPALMLLIYNQAFALQIIIDEEAEDVIGQIAKPIFRAAKLPDKDLKIKIVQDDNINAFVADNHNIYLFTELITFSETPEVLAGVIAHECGHIALGHISLTKEKTESLKKEMIATTLLGAAAALITGNVAAVGAAVMGGSHATQIGFFKHSRIQESQADAAAVKYLEKIKLSTNGLTELLKHLNSNERIFFKGTNPYLLTHPISKERINYIKQHTISAPDKLPEDIRRKYKMVVAKVFAFTAPFKETMKRYKGSGKADIYARSIAHYKIGKLAQALEFVDQLLALEPDNPYFIELKAQFLYENGKVKGSIAYYEHALKLKPTSATFKIELAAALITANENLKKAEKLFRSAIDDDNSDFSAWHGLGVALGKMKIDHYSHVALARAFAIIGDKQTAQKFITSSDNQKALLKSSFYKNALEEAKAMVKD